MPKIKSKSWREKLLDDKDLPKIVPTRGKMKPGKMFIPAPRQVDAIMKKVRPGKLITINQIRTKLTEQNNADMTCPITTGIFAWIAAHAAEESVAAGKKNITPYWRTLKSGGELNAKYPGGIARLRSKLKAEGHQVIARGKRFFVAGFEKGQ